jgi:hypothetical protein
MKANGRAARTARWDTKQVNRQAPSPKPGHEVSQPPAAGPQSPQRPATR